MKKIFLSISILSLALLTIIIIISKSKNIVVEDKYYSIPKIMTYNKDDTNMYFDIYINNKNNIIEYINQNTYYLKNNNDSYKLNVISIDKIISSYYNEEQYYKYTLNCDILNIFGNDIFLDKCYINIQNDKFNLTCFVGTIKIYNDVIEKLEFSDLYGNYSYVNNELHFVGFTIKLDNKYKQLNNIEIGNCYGLLNYIEKDVLYDSQRNIEDLSYSPVNDKNNLSSYKLTAKQNYYYIPVSYSNLYLFNEGTIILIIDNKKYYLEHFIFLANDILINDYNNILSKGEIVNA